MENLSRLKAVLQSFARIGFMGFGGPFAAIAMMEEEFVRRRGWVSPDRFAEIYAICKLLPGPIGPQVAIAVGKECSGVRGGVVAGLAFIIPSFLLVVGIAALYSSGHAIPKQDRLLHGVQLGALAVVFATSFQLFRPSIRLRRAWVLALVNAALTYLHPAMEPLYILGTGLFGVLISRERLTPAQKEKPPRALHVGVALALSGATLGQPALLQLFWTCFKSSAFVFGTGLAILPLLENDFVTRLQWITHAQFMDSIAVGQITPGPFTISVAFIGYLVSGWVGACVASLGMFLPSFINVLILLPRVWDRFKQSSASGVFVQWAVPAVVGCIFAAAIRLARMSVDQPIEGIWVLVGIIALAWKRVPSWALLIVSGLLGLGWGGR